LYALLTLLYSTPINTVQFSTAAQLPKPPIKDEIVLATNL